jgi:hypothetical protein
MKPRIILLAGAIALAFASPLALGHDSQTARVNFSKCPLAVNPADAPPGTILTNAGTATGGATGPLKAFVLPGSLVPLAPNVIFLSAKYVVEAGARSFTAHVVGRYDLNIGEAELFGVVSEGWLAGSKVVDKFHSTAAGCVAGRLTITSWPLADDDDED